MRKIHLYHLSFAALAACIPALAFATSASAGAAKRPSEAAIKAENARWSEAFGRGDYEAIGRLYTEDGALLPPDGNRIIGPRAITEYFMKGSAGSEHNTVSFSNYEFYGNDQTVTEVSDAEIRDHDGKIKVRAKQTLIFLRQGGTWKLHRDMWSAYPSESSNR